MQCRGVSYTALTCVKQCQAQCHTAGCCHLVNLMSLCVTLQGDATCESNGTSIHSESIVTTAVMISTDCCQLTNVNKHYYKETSLHEMPQWDNKLPARHAVILLSNLLLVSRTVKRLISLIMFHAITSHVNHSYHTQYVTFFNLFV